MAGYTSRILLTFTIPFFGFVLWFLKKKKSSRSVSSTGIQVEDSTFPALFEKHIFELDVDSTLYKNLENSCEDNAAMQLKETQTVEPQSTGISQQNGTSQNSVQENGLSQDCVQQNGQLHDCVLQNSLSHDCAQQHSGIQEVHLNDIPHTNVQQNGASDNAISNISKDSVQNSILESNALEKSVSTNCVLHNGVSQKSVLQNGTQQNGTSKGKKKKSKGREKSNTCPTDIINSKERLHLEDEIQLVQQFGIIDIHAPTKNELLNAINKNEMDKTNCDSQSSSCVNGDSNLEIDLPTVKIEEAAKESDNDVYSTSERNLKETQPSIQTEISTDPATSERNPKEIQHSTQTEISTDPETSEMNSKEQPSTQTDICIDPATSEKNLKETHPSTLTEIGTDPCTSLILPADCVNAIQINGDMIVSPGASYCDSLGSIDSGRGASELHISPTQEGAAVLNYAFEIPQKLVGLLIGKQGKNVNLIKQKTNADILIKRHPTSIQNKICVISGTDDEINAALQKIREKFPPERFPNVTLTQMCLVPFLPCPENLMLRLPEGSSFDVMLSATVTAGHFFLQQPTHPTFHSLLGLTFNMTQMYINDVTAPRLPHMEKGFICAANLSNCWYRAEVDEVFYDTDECRLKFLDYGGYSILPRAALRQINCQFMNVPFQATECYLGLVTLPEGQTEWSPQATAYFEELAQGQILQGFIVAYAENGVPYVQLYRITGVEQVDINMALVQKGHAKCIKPQPVV